MNLDETLERTQWDLFWLPRGVRVVERPEVLYLASPGGADYVNVVLRVRAPDGALPALVAEVAAAHANGPSRWMLGGGSRGAAVERSLAAAGYRPTHEHFGYAIDVGAFRPRSTADVVVEPVTDRAGLLDCLSVSARAFGRPPPSTDDATDDDLALCTGPDARVHRFVARDRATGAPLASGGLNAHPDLDVGFLWAGGTVPEARSRGAYSALVAARVARAAALGLGRVGLYARAATSAAIVAAHGFTRAGPMTYWERRPPPRAESS